jgi:hypothetical protein
VGTGGNLIFRLAVEYYRTGAFRPPQSEEKLMHAPMKFVEKWMSIAANGVW